jgi:UDP-N-acetylglucosamine acyltransferase
VVKDIPPYSLVGDEPLRFGGVNKVGLERRGFSAESIAAVRSAYKAIYYSGMNVTEALAKIEASGDFSFAEVKHVVEFIRRSQRGIIGR